MRTIFGSFFGVMENTTSHMRCLLSLLKNGMKKAFQFPRVVGWGVIIGGR